MFKCSRDITTVFDQDYGVERSFRLYQEQESLHVLRKLGITLIEGPDQEQLSGLMYFTDPKGVDHCVLHARKPG